MRRMLLASAVAVTLFGLAPGRADPVYQSSTIACPRAAIYDASTSGATKLVTGTATQQIYVCGYVLNGAAAVNVGLVYGTGGTCGLGTTPVTPAYRFTGTTGNPPIVDHQTYYAGLVPVPSGNDLCLNTSGAVAVQAVVYYTQF